MKKEITLATIVLLLVMAVNAQNKTTETFLSPGMLSIGTRNTFSIFNDDNATGIGIGGQARVQLSNRIGSEWFFDYITSKNGTSTIRNDYHIGWSLMYYPIKDRETPTFLQPYIIAGHCFDYSKVAEQGNGNNYANRWSMATQAGIGTHFNITNRFDCSLSSQYMMHFGKEIETSIDKGNVLIDKKAYSGPHGHMLVSLSFNYKLFHLFN